MTDLTGRTLGRYRLETLLGRGGMADVWRATDTKLARTVAVKVIHATYAQDPQFAERFLREARVVASLEHPNILPVYDFGDEGGIPFLVMPHLAGGTLRDRLHGSPSPLAVAAAWIRQLADALDAAHAAGILHRDVKPANVLLGRDDRLFLADFGIAKMVETMSGLTATGVVVGTPVYMAPEQAQGQPASPATDRYSLGVVAYEILAGRPPFEGDNPLSLMHQHVSTQAPALSTKVGGLPAGLDAVLDRALSKNPAERPPTCRALADAVYAFVPTGVLPAVSSGAWGTPAAGTTAPTVIQSRGATPPAGVPGTKPWEPPFPTSPSVRVATPAPSLTSDATVLTAGRKRRRGLSWAVGAAALALVAFVAAGIAGKAKRDAEKAALAAPTPAPAAPVVPTPAPAAPVTVVEMPAAPTAAPAPPTPDPKALEDARLRAKEERRIADLEKRVKDAESAAEEARTSAEKAAAAERAAQETAAAERAATPPPAPPPAPAAAGPLAEARERLDVSRKTDHRLTREDFQFAQAAARRVLAERPKSPEAHYLSTYATGGLAYANGNDAVASALVVESLVGLRRAGKGEPRLISLLVVKNDGTIVPPRGWELALCYGDVRGEAMALLEAAIRENPRDVRALKARAVLRRQRGLAAP